MVDLLLELLKHSKIFLFAAGVFLLLIAAIGEIRSNSLAASLKPYQRLFLTVVGAPIVLVGLFLAIEESRGLTPHYFLLHGKIVSEETEAPISDASIIIGDKQFFSDDQGEFNINHKQENKGRYVRIDMNKEGFYAGVTNIILRQKSESIYFNLKKHPAPSSEVLAEPHTISLGALYSGSLSIAVSSNDTEIESLVSEFKSDFPDFELHIKTFRPDKFLSGIQYDSPEARLPDISFIDNYRQLGPLKSTGAVVGAWGRGRFGYHGWWVIARNSEKKLEAKAFLRWLSRSPNWAPPRIRTISSNASSLENVRRVTGAVLTDFCEGNVKRAAKLLDPKAARFSEQIGTSPVVIEEFQPMLMFGNERIAFVLAAIVGENNESYGMRHTFTILRRVKNDWRVLFLTPNTQLPLLEELIESFDNAGFKAGEERFLPEVEIVGPTDNVSLPRYPEKPALQWKPLRKDIALYLVEFQFGQKKPNSWSNSWIEPVRQQAGQKSAISITAPFGVGAQPHRWRVWAIARDGNVSISEWRIINFSN